MTEIKNKKMLRRLEIYCLVFIVSIAFWVRIKNIFTWISSPEMFATYQGEPLPTNYDSYYYLSLAKDLVEHTYTDIDHKRAYPDGYARPFPPPLLSVLAAGLAKTTPLSLNWIAAILSAVLGVLIIFPLYGLGRFFGGGVGGLSASLLGVLSKFYIARSNFGWFDTDSLIVCLSLAICYFLLKFGVSQGKKKYAHLLGGIIAGLLLVWAWDSTRIVAAGIFGATFLASILFLFRPKSSREALIFAFFIAIACLLALFWNGTEFIHYAIEHVSNLFAYITKQSYSNFPNIGKMIAEQAKPSLTWIAMTAAGNILLFGISIIGFCSIFHDRWREGLPLVPLLVLSFFSIFAIRFVLFLVPICALGTGVFLAKSWRHYNRSKFLPPVLFLMTLYCLFPTFWVATMAIQWPLRSSWLVDGLNKISSLTPPDAVIWTMPEGGYETNYWSRRATISDGSIHDGEHMVYNTLPFATDDFRLSANFIQFYAVRGKKGVHSIYEAVGEDQAEGLKLIKSVLAAGPEEGRLILERANLNRGPTVKNIDEWLEFLYPTDSPPIYVLIDFRMLRGFNTIFKLGTWDIAKLDGDKAYRKLFIDVKMEKNTLISDYGIKADLIEGKIFAMNKNFLLKQVDIADYQEIKTYDFDHEDGWFLNVYLPGNFATLQDKRCAYAVLNRLFFYGHFVKSSYFEPVARKMPAYQLFKLHADQWR